MLTERWYDDGTGGLMSDLSRKELIMLLGSAGPMPRLSGLDLSGLDLKYFCFDGAILTGTDFSGCNLRRATFKGSDGAGELHRIHP